MNPSLEFDFLQNRTVVTTRWIVCDDLPRLLKRVWQQAQVVPRLGVLDEKLGFLLFAQTDCDRPEGLFHQVPVGAI